LAVGEAARFAYEATTMITQLKNKRRSARERAVGASLAEFERLIMAVKGAGGDESKVAKAQEVLKTLAEKEDIPLAYVGGLGAIYHGYERNTKDIDIVVARQHLDVLLGVAPNYGIKVIWRDPQGWHKLEYRGVKIDVVPEGGKPRPDALTTIPGPKHLGVTAGADYAHLAGWMETKLGSNRIHDQADVVQVMKVTPARTLASVRNALSRVHRSLVRRFDELRAAGDEEMKQERERGPR
jgi:hypothetical protein